MPADTAKAAGAATGPDARLTRLTMIALAAPALPMSALTIR